MYANHLPQKSKQTNNPASSFFYSKFFKPIVILIFLFFVTPNAHAAITLIANTCQGLGASGGTSTGINTTGASLIVVTSSGDSNDSIPTLSDNKSNTWSTAIEEAGIANNNGEYLWYVASPTTSTSHTFTISGNNFNAICISAYTGTGTNTSTVLDQHNGNAYAGNGLTLSAGSVTPTLNGEVVVTSVNCDGTDITSIGSSFNLLSPTVAQSGGNWFANGMAYYVQSTAANLNPTWTCVATPLGSTSIIATFYAAIIPVLTVKGGLTVKGRLTVQ